MEASFTCMGHSLEVERKSPVNKTGIKNKDESSWTDDDTQMHEFIESNDGVTLAEIAVEVNRYRLGMEPLSLSAVNTRLTGLSKKDYKLYEDTIWRDVEKERINKKTGEVTIEIVKQKDTLYYIDKE